MKIYLVALFLVYSSILSYSQTAEEFNKMAEEKFKIKEYKNAMNLINKAIALDNKNHWYYLFKAEIQFELTGPLDAIVIIREAIQLDITRAEPYSRTGNYYASAGMADSAIAMYNLAIHYSKDDTVKYSYVLNRGAAFLGKRDFKSAAKDFESVLDFDPKNIAALNNLSPTYRELGKVDKSILCLKKIIELDSNFVGTYINLGFIYSDLDSLKLALNYFNKVVAMDPEEAVTYNNRGHVYYKMGEYMLALKDITKSIEMYPTNSYAYRNLALVHIALNKMEDACKALSMALNYGFEQRYGPEVGKLAKKHCKKQK